MLASDVAQLVRTQLVHQLDQARGALPALRGGVDQMAEGVVRGNVDAMLATARLGRAVREAAIAETMLVAVGGRHGQLRVGGAAREAIESAATLLRHQDEARPSLEMLVRRARSSMDDPSAFAAARSAIDDRLDEVATRLDEADEAIVARTPAKDDGVHGWISEDGELHEFA